MLTVAPDHYSDDDPFAGQDADGARVTTAAVTYTEALRLAARAAQPAPLTAARLRHTLAAITAAEGGVLHAPIPIRSREEDR